MNCRTCSGYTWSHLFVADRHNLLLRGSALSIDAAIVLQPAPAPAMASLAIYRDTLLEDLNGLDPAFDQWLEEERARFARIGRNIAEGLLARSPDPPSTLAIAEDLLLIDQTHESAWRAIIRVHDEGGNRSLALATRTIDAVGQWRTPARCRPSPETEELISRVRAPAASARSGRRRRPRPIGPSLFHIDVRRERSALRLRGPGPAAGRHRGRRPRRRPDGGNLRRTVALPLDLLRAGIALARRAARRCPAPAAGETLGAADADFVLDGTIQRSGTRLRITSRLIDLRAGGEIVWAARFDRADDRHAGPAGRIRRRDRRPGRSGVDAHEGRRTADAGRDDLSARDLLLKALPSMYRMERPDSSTPAGCWNCRGAPNPEAPSCMAGWRNGTCSMSARAGRTTGAARTRPPTG